MIVKTVFKRVNKIKTIKNTVFSLDTLVSYFNDKFSENMKLVSKTTLKDYPEYDRTEDYL